MCATCELIRTVQQSDDLSVFKNTDSSVGELASTQDIAGDATTSTTLDLGGSITSDIASSSDQDWIAVQLTAGQTYQFNVSGASAANGALPDSTLAIRNSAGQQLAFNDDANNSFYSQLTFTAPTTGTYYLDVGGYSTAVGGYRLSGFDTATPPPASPVDALAMSYVAPTVIDVYFVAGGVSVREPDGTTYTTSASWTAAQVAQAMLAFEQFSNVANVTFNVTSTLSEADFVMIQATAGGNLGYFGVGGGNMTIGGVAVNVDGYGNFNVNGTGWNSAGLQQGGYGFVTLIHEIGHGMGLAHPHDSGGGSTILQGVTSPFGDYGDFNLNQGIYTTMSYNDGWQLAPHGTPNPSLGYGWQGTMMALDIAALQQTYGANSNYNTGNNTYVLPTANTAGTYYASIWDAGGNDTIAHNGSTSATIDLRAATLDYSALGGGAVSYAAGIHGGFTIANGVVIENALGGSGNDVITGNDFANFLDGRGGNDRVVAGGGDDTVVYDAADTILAVGGQGTDTLLFRNTAINQSFNLTAQGFELARHEETDVGNTEAWTTRVRTYDANWAQTSETGVLDNTNTWSTQFDTAGANTWASIYTERTAGGATARIITTNDDSSRRVDTWDTGSAAWNNSVQLYNSAGTLYSQTTRLDNGSSTFRQWEIADAAWDFSISYYNASGTLFHQETNLDNGSSTIRRWEIADAAWDFSISYYNASGTLFHQDTTLDNGTSTIRRWEIADAAWDFSVSYYNASGTLFHQETTLDNGTSTVRRWEIADAAWDFSISYYDSAGVLYYQDVEYDNGSSIIRRWDTGSAAWDRSQQVYDTQNRLTRSDVHNDNGTYSYTFYDVDNVHSWATVRQTYAADNSLLSVVYTDDVIV